MGGRCAEIVMAPIVMAGTNMPRQAHAGGDSGDARAIYVYIGHEYRDHWAITRDNYVGHNYSGHNYIGHNYMGHEYRDHWAITIHNYIGHN